MTSMAFKPIYGWGWFQGPVTKSLEVPPLFKVSVERSQEDQVIGIIEAPHIFAGMEVRLGLRSIMEGQKHWNVYLLKAEHGPITGFAESV